MLRTIDLDINDRGSRYAVSGGPAQDADAAKALVAQLCQDKRFKKATHNTWALIGSQGAVKNDDGESGAGMVIVRMLERAGLCDHTVIVTRWYGGKHLGGDRFRHVQTAVRTYLAALEPEM